MANPELMFTHALNPIKGWPQENALDIEGTLHSDVTFDVPAGRVVHVTAVNTESGFIDKHVPEFKTGVVDAAMPLFLLQASDADDVENPGRTSGGAFVHDAISPSGVMSALVATGGYELQTTEFDSNRTYSPGDPLTADNDDTTEADGGVLDNHNSNGTTLTAPYKSGGTTEPMVGVVSRGVFENEHGVSALHFWPTYFPAGA